MENVCGVERPTWDVVVSSQMPLPAVGDTVYFLTEEGLSIYDTLLIQGIASAAQGPVLLHPNLLCNRIIRTL